MYLNYEDCEIYHSGQYLYVLFKNERASKSDINNKSMSLLIDSKSTTKKSYITINKTTLFFCDIGKVVGVYGYYSYFSFFKNNSSTASSLSSSEINALPTITAEVQSRWDTKLDCSYIISTPAIPFKGKLCTKTSTKFEQYNASSLLKQKGLMPSIYSTNVTKSLTNIRNAPSTIAFKKNKQYTLKRSEVINNLYSTLANQNMLELFIEVIKTDTTSYAQRYFFKYFRSVYSCDKNSFKNTNNITVLLKDGSTKTYSFKLKYFSNSAKNKDLEYRWYVDTSKTSLYNYFSLFEQLCAWLFITYECFQFTNMTDFVEYSTERKEYLSEILEVNPDNISDIYLNLDFS